MRVSVNAVVAALTVEGRLVSGKVTEHREGEIAQVVTAKDAEDLIGQPGAAIGNDDGNAVEDGVFALASDIGADERAFEDFALLFFGDLSDAEWMDFAARGATDGADRAE